MERNPSPTPEHRILLAEDDAASRAFLAAALGDLGWRVAACADGVAALHLARTECFDLLLLDRKLPGLGAVEVLTTLRADPTAASHAATAFASSAEWLPRRRTEALAAGFETLVEKPITVAQLAVLVAPWRVTSMAVRDDASGVIAAGSTANLAALRRLFVAELDRLARDLAAQRDSGDAAWRDRLHRLCASAGFCGAPALAEASRAWSQALRDGDGGAAARQRFLEILAATRTELAAI